MSDKHLNRVRKICLALPETTEKLSHGEPTFFVRKKVFAMFSNNHHKDGHVAVLVPTPPGVQEMLIEGAPRKFYKPPYVGVRGWVGIELARISDKDLAFHINEAWRLIAPKRLQASAAPLPYAARLSGPLARSDGPPPRSDGPSVPRSGRRR
ncbi:MAG TPA: MmcQ/YjbR family DNA-binding protein [Blastocatellia bacterium]|nr:MmcQ/YjbR family DNA-binding protein [Blastocatellia bacterium]